MQAWEAVEQAQRLSERRMAAYHELVAIDDAERALYAFLSASPAVAERFRKLLAPAVPEPVEPTATPKCETCGAVITLPPRRGPKPKYCGAFCRPSMLAEAGLR